MHYPSSLVSPDKIWYYFSGEKQPTGLLPFPRGPFVALSCVDCTFRLLGLMTDRKERQREHQWRANNRKPSCRKRRSRYTGGKRNTTIPLQSLLGRPMPAIRVFMSVSRKISFPSALKNTRIC